VGVLGRGTPKRLCLEEGERGGGTTHREGDLIVDMKEDFLLFSAPEVTPLGSPLSVDLFS
jgi:hypothetical protein